MLKGVIPMLPTPFNYEKDIIFDDISNLIEQKGIIYVWTNKNLKSRKLEIKIRNDLGVKQKILNAGVHLHLNRVNLSCRSGVEARVEAPCI